MVAACHVVEEETELPCCAFSGSFGSCQPGGSEEIQSLANGGQVAQVMSLRLYLPKEGTALGGSEHVQESILGKLQPADRAAPVVIHGTEGGPCPAELAQRLHETPHWASTIKGLHVVLELLGKAAQEGVAVHLAPEPQEGLALGDGVDFQSVAWDADGHEGPKFHPSISFGANGSFEGVVVGRLYRA